MAEYQKYMFDNFVVPNTPEEYEEAQFSAETPSDAELPEEDEATIVEDTVEQEEVIAPEVTELPTEEVAKEQTFSKAELDAAVKLAEEKAYDSGFAAAVSEEAKKHDLLLEDINKQLTDIFSGLDRKTAELENSALHFATELLRKVLPTLEKERAEAEVKNFMAQNFANFAGQETLSFAFNPETISLVADSIGRLAEQNDFEGKIAVHKDDTLGPGDCRIEWKNGGVERKVSDTLDRVEELIKSNAQERENG